jgi:hypothetical protein
MKKFIKRLFGKPQDDLVSRIAGIEYTLSRLETNLVEISSRLDTVEEEFNRFEYDLEDNVREFVDSHFDPVSCYTFEELEGKVDEMKEEIEESRYVPVSLLPEYVYEIIVENYETIERKLKVKKDQQ